MKIAIVQQGFVTNIQLHCGKTGGGFAAVVSKGLCKRNHLMQRNKLLLPC